MSRARERSLYAAAVIGAVAALAVSHALADAPYPEHPIKLVVPVPPGGTADILPRVIAAKLSERWAEPVIVENHPGAALNLGAEMVARAKPDGYTLLVTPPGPLVTNQFLTPHLSFDPSAFVPVTVLAKTPYVLVARSALPVSSVQDLIAYAKANPGKLTFASSGVGSPPHLAMKMLEVSAAIRLVHVPYHGLTPALQDVVGGQVDLMLHDPSSTRPFIESGRLKALAVSSLTRLRELPSVPTVADAVPGFDVATWYGVVAPARTSAAIAAKLSAAIADILRQPDVTARFSQLSIMAVGSTPTETAAFFKAETARWRAVAAHAVPNPK